LIAVIEQDIEGTDFMASLEDGDIEEDRENDEKTWNIPSHLETVHPLYDSFSNVKRRY
jgi:hypothetical protein